MISVFELFKIGVGPSSSHTVGPMKAAAAFASGLALRGALDRVAAVEVTLLGSLAFTGRGHATDKAVILGLSGIEPEDVDPDAAEALIAEVRDSRRLPLAGKRPIGFDPASAIIFDVVNGCPDDLHANRLWPSIAGARTGAERDQKPSRDGQEIRVERRRRGAYSRSPTSVHRAPRRSNGRSTAPAPSPSALSCGRP